MVTSFPTGHWSPLVYTRPVTNIYTHRTLLTTPSWLQHLHADIPAPVIGQRPTLSPPDLKHHQLRQSISQTISQSNKYECLCNPKADSYHTVYTLSIHKQHLSPFHGALIQHFIVGISNHEAIYIRAQFEGNQYIMLHCYYCYYPMQIYCIIKRR